MKNKIIISAITIMSLSSLQALEFKPLGFKSVGMGGVGVANSRGAMASYYNPAMLKYSNHKFEFSINTTIRGKENNLINNADRLKEIELENSINTISKNSKKSNLYVESQLLTQNGNNILSTADNDIILTNLEKFAIDLLNVNDTITIDGKNFILKENGKLIYTQDSILNNQESIESKEATESLREGIDILTNKIGKDNSFSIAASPSVNFQIGDSFGIGLYTNIDANLAFDINDKYNKLITKKQNEDGRDFYYEYDLDTKIYSVKLNNDKYQTNSLEYALDNEVNYIEVTTKVHNEIPISYAYLLESNYGSFSIGGSLKPMSLKSYTKRIFIDENSLENELDSDLSDNETIYKSTFGFDLGMAYRPIDSKFTIGLVAKNLNSPEFKVESSKVGINESDKIEPMVRGGFSIPIWNDNIELAFDADLTKNKTVMGDDESQLIGGGIDFHPSSWFSLRVGAMKDKASKKYDEGMIYTTGIGLGLKWFQIELSGMASEKTSQFKDNDIPRYMAVNFSIVSKWGNY